MRTNNLKLTSLALGLYALLGAAACSDDDSSDALDSGAEGGRVSRAGSGGKGGQGGKGGEGTSDAGGSEAGKGGVGGQGGKGGSGDGDDECFDGEPEETEQFLNRCTDSECQPFDNAERLPLLKDGKLPALP
jgi:hypothetical protein